MKFATAILQTIVILCSCSKNFKFVKIQDNNWIVIEKTNRLIYVKKDSLQLLCCSLGPIHKNDDTSGFKIPYWLELEKSEIMKQKEIKRRIIKQNRILDTLEKHGGKSELTYNRHISFMLRKNIIDSLRVPIGRKKGHSFYLKDALEEYGYLNLYFKESEDVKKLISFRKNVFMSLGIKYQAPNWLDEYLPFEKYKNTKMNKDFQ